MRRRGSMFLLFAACGAAGVLSAVLLAASPSATADNGATETTTTAPAPTPTPPPPTPTPTPPPPTPTPTPIPPRPDHDSRRRHGREPGARRRPLAGGRDHPGEGVLRAPAAPQGRAAEVQRDAEAARRLGLCGRRDPPGADDATGAERPAESARRRCRRSSATSAPWLHGSTALPSTRACCCATRSRS